MNRWVFLVAGFLILAVMRTSAAPLEENNGGEKLDEGEAKEHRIVKRSDESYSSEEFGRRKGFFNPGRRSFIGRGPSAVFPQTSQIFYPFSLSRNDFSQRNTNRKGPIYRSGFPGNYYRGREYYGGRNYYHGNGYPGGDYYGKQYNYQHYDHTPYYNGKSGYQYDGRHHY